MKIYQVKQDERALIKISKSGEYLVELLQPGAEAEIVGSFLVESREKLSVNIVVHHKARHTVAHTTFRGVVRDSGKLTFLGKIIIDPDCGLSNSFLTQKVLVLSAQATAQVVPELEILTDDVKCSHAASVSQIPEQQIFYLMSRGLSKKQAEDLIVTGFLAVDKD